MNFYKRHLGDIAKGCGHLSQGQMGAYDLLLDWLYGNEKPLPLAPEKLYRIARATTKQERENTLAVLAEFFLASDTGYTHKRVAEELAKAEVVAETNRRIALEREAAKREGGARSVHEACEKRGQSVAPIQNPESRLQEANDPSDHLSAAADCPHAEILRLYHEALPANPRIKTWSGTRAANLRARWREDAKRQSLDYWQRFFAHVAASEFLTGRSADRNGRAFTPGLDWLVLPNNFAKVIEGRYHDAR
jgi:uncharacterized protein YdaU (DUF1376 family)